MSSIQPNLTITRHRYQVQYFPEALGQDIKLDMVFIPGGQFRMGAPESEVDSSDQEKPQHLVTVPAFFIGKYPVTQAQWKAVASLAQVNRELELDPSRFKGKDRPVEQVSWHDAIEFCDRLSQHSGKPYRLPSEAQWEYACRAGTTAPFHCGETITPDLANYRGNYVYGAGIKGAYRQETTPVGSFPANAFGLYDMHGNVWEWCLDHWHETYEGAPGDGSVWIEGGDDSYRSLRGGSWIYAPGNCRSAFRARNAPDDCSDNCGFRVICSVSMML